MPATIFVWRPTRALVGHASLALDDGTYVSWWPATSEVLDAPARSFGMGTDRSARGEGRIPDYASAPIGGLDDASISAWWREISGRKPDDFTRSRREPLPAIGRFRLLAGANCSNMVARALVVGGVLGRYPLASVIIGNNPVMTPLTLIDVAEAMTGDALDATGALARSASVPIATARTLWQYVLAR